MSRTDSFQSHAEIINAWPAPALVNFAEDIGEEYGTVKAMRRRNSIPPGYWPAVVEKAGARGIEGVTYERLSLLIAAKRGRGGAGK